jgi:hypothetical protein
VLFIFPIVFPIYTALVSAGLILFFSILQILIVILLPRIIYMSYLKSRKIKNNETLEKKYEIYSQKQLQMNKRLKELR